MKPTYSFLEALQLIPYLDESRLGMFDKIITGEQKLYGKTEFTILVNKMQQRQQLLRLNASGWRDKLSFN